MYMRASNRDPISLTHKVAVGGEGTVWQTQVRGVLAKIFHTPEVEKIKKLRLMMEHPPFALRDTSCHLTIAWPQDILLEEERPVGFLMPCVPGALSLNYVYNAKLRRKNAPGFNWYYLHVAALNMVKVIKALHDDGYVIGDLKTDNFLVTDQALISIIDTDSFQIQGVEENFYCSVGSEGFTPPELIGCDLKHTLRNQSHDCFGVAVLVHLLLMGFHPFSGNTEDAAHTLDACVQKGLIDLKDIRTGASYITYEDIHSGVKEAFYKVFVQGERLAASTWAYILQEAIQCLAPCSSKMSHFYDDHHEHCIWCYKEKAFGFNVFPGEAAQEKITVLQSFKRLVSRGDYRGIIDVWNQYGFLQDIFNTSTREYICVQRAHAFMDSLERFKKFCGGVVNTEDILQFWEQDQNLHFFVPTQEEQVKGKSIEVFLQDIKNDLEGLRGLQRSIEIADDFYRLHQSYDEYLERAILEKFQEGNIKQVRLKERVQQAEKVLYLFGKISDLVQQKDFKGMKDLLQVEGIQIEKIQLPSLYKDFISTCRAYEEIGTCFQEMLDQGADEEKILELWDMHADFQETNLIHAAVFEDISLYQLIERLHSRKEKRAMLEVLWRQKDFVGMAKEWDEEICIGEDFERFMPFVEQGKSMQKSWHKLKKSLLEKESLHVMQEWKESLKPLVDAEGLTASLEYCFEDHFKDVHFNEGFLSQVFYEHKRLFVRWPWPEAQSEVPLCWVAVRKDRYPLHPNDVDKLHHSLVFKKAAYQESRVSILWSDEKAYVAVWPCIKAGDHPIILGQPLQIETKQVPVLQYKIRAKRIFKRTILDIEMLASEAYDFADLEIVASIEAPPLSFEPKPPLAVIEALSMEKDRKYKQKLSIDATDKSAIFRIYPKDRRVLNSYAFQAL